MKRSRHRGTYSEYALRNESVVQALKLRATDRVKPLGHTLGLWSPAKRKHGVSAMKALCTTCGEQVVVMPQHCHNTVHLCVPAMSGDVLFQLCYREGRLV